MTKEPSESIKILMLRDAGYHDTPLQINYLKLIEFIKWIRSRGCDHPENNDCRSCAALDLLRELKED